MLHHNDTYALALAGPGNHSPSSVTSSSPLTPVSMPPRLSEGKYPGHIGLGLPFTGGIKQRKMRVTAPEVVGGYMPGRKDKSVTSTSEEVDEATDTTDYDGSDSTSASDAVRGEEASPPLLSPRRSRGPRPSPSDSLSAIISEDGDIRTPEAGGSPVVAAPNAPRIPFPHTPMLHDHSWSFEQGPFLVPQRGGPGRDLTDVNSWQREQSTITYPCSNVAAYSEGESFLFNPFFEPTEIRPMPTSHCVDMGLGIMLEQELLVTGSGRGFDRSRSPSLSGKDSGEEEAYYHLPSDLLSPDPVMSPSKLFATSVRRWTQRRQEARRVAMSPVHARL